MMTWVITRLCRDCLDTSCVEACPVDCSYEYVGPSADRSRNQLYIDPEECIDCQACEPVCPWEAPLCDTEVPAVLEDDIALNASIVECKDKFRVPRHIDKPQPTTSDVAANKHKWDGPAEGAMRAEEASTRDRGARTAAGVRAQRQCRRASATALESNHRRCLGAVVLLAVEAERERFDVDACGYVLTSAASQQLSDHLGRQRVLPVGDKQPGGGLVHAALDEPCAQLVV